MSNSFTAGSMTLGPGPRTKWRWQRPAASEPALPKKDIFLSHTYIVDGN